jgi:hypothetical protein
MDRITKFLILLVAALVLAPGCFAAENATASDAAAGNTTELVKEVANATLDANNTTVDASMNLTNVSPLAATTGANTSAAKATTI